DFAVDEPDFTEVLRINRHANGIAASACWRTWVPRGSQNGIYGMSCGHSGLMLAPRMTFAHFSVSSAMNLPKSAGVIDFGTLPMPANCVINLGSARAASIASWSLSMIAAGVSFGATTPFHTLAS